MRRRLKPGTPVWFRGTQDPETGLMTSAGGDGTDWFLATVHSELFVGNVYCLSWGDGSHVGIPFSWTSLVPAQVRK